MNRLLLWLLLKFSFSVYWLVGLMLIRLMFSLLYCNIGLLWFWILVEGECMWRNLVGRL